MTMTVMMMIVIIVMMMVVMMVTATDLPTGQLSERFCTVARVQIAAAAVCKESLE